MALENFHRFSPQKGGWTLPKGTSLRFKKGQGYYTVADKGPVKKVKPDPLSIAGINQTVKDETGKWFTSQQQVSRSEADRLRKEAADRALAMQNAYSVAAQMNAELGKGAQEGWNAASGVMSGLAGAGTDAISRALQAETANQDAALARVGQAGTGFDASGQAAVENYLGGTLPAGSFARYGGIDNEFFNRMGQTTNLRGVQEGQAAKMQSNREIDKQYLDQIGELTRNRAEYGMKLKDKLMAQRYDAIKLQQEAIADRNDAILAQNKLEQDYRIALMKAQNADDKLQIQRIYNAEKIRLETIKAQASAAAANALAGLRGVQAADIKANPGTGGSGGKKGKVKTVADVAADVSSRIGQSGISLAPQTNKQTGKPLGYKYRLHQYLVKVYLDQVPKAQRPALRKKLWEIAQMAPDPDATSNDPFASR